MPSPRITAGGVLGAAAMAMAMAVPVTGHAQVTNGPCSGAGTGNPVQHTGTGHHSFTDSHNNCVAFNNPGNTAFLNDSNNNSIDALINAMLPIMTVTGTAFGALLGGSVAVERAFGVPGLGLALVFAVAERDWMLIQNLVLLYGVIFVLINLVVDVSYGWFDPRIRYQ